MESSYRKPNLLYLRTKGWVHVFVSLPRPAEGATWQPAWKLQTSGDCPCRLINSNKGSTPAGTLIVCGVCMSGGRADVRTVCTFLSVLL